MEKNAYKNIIDGLFGGTISDEELDLLDRTLGGSPDSDFDEYCRSHWDKSQHTVSGQGDFPKIKADIMRRIATEEDFIRRTKRRKMPLFLKIAAVAASLVVAVLSGYFISEADHKIQVYEVLADRGQKSMVTLPDGSRIWLNSASKITYTSDFNSKNRNITLEGEAYFDVAKNNELPFVVSTDDMSVTALGTEFNVKSYEEDECVTATLVGGRIRTEAGGLEVILDPWEEVVLDKNSGKLVKTNVSNRRDSVPWRKNVILFEGETLDQVAVMLERMYNVEVIVDEGIGEYGYTGLISNNSLTNVLDLISGTSPVDYTLTGNLVKFSPRGR